MRQREAHRTVRGAAAGLRADELDQLDRLRSTPAGVRKRPTLMRGFRALDQRPGNPLRRHVVGREHLRRAALAAR